MVNAAKVEHFKKISVQHNCQLVAVTKKRGVEDVMDLYRQGQKVYGENRALDLRDKAKALLEDMEWHFIGHLQTNKIKHIIPYVSLIHSVDSFNLLEAINEHASKHKKIVNYLLQFHIAEETAKYGFDQSKITDLIEYFKLDKNKHTTCCGVMGMATFTDNKKKVKQEFVRLKEVFDELKTHYFKNHTHFKEISMGMSGDYELAIEAGSTMLRIGSALFSEEKIFI